jgi:lysophospholipase L1-like esterase
MMSQTTVFIGDSVTDCGRLNLPPYGDGYVRDIFNSGKLEGAIINVGTSGHRLVDLIARWDDDVLAHNPTRISIAIGVNDTWRRYDDNDPTSVEDFETNYDEVLAKTKAACHPDFVLCEPFLLHVKPEMETWREDLDPKIAVVHKLAKKYDAKLVPFDSYLNGLLDSHTIEELADDGIHPSVLGHQLMAELWLKTVLD